MTHQFFKWKLIKDSFFNFYTEITEFILFYHNIHEKKYFVCLCFCVCEWEWECFFCWDFLKNIIFCQLHEKIIFNLFLWHLFFFRKMVRLITKTYKNSIFLRFSKCRTHFLSILCKSIFWLMVDYGTYCFFAKNCVFHKEKQQKIDNLFSYFLKFGKFTT
jgi:hypothetical protein